MNAITICRPPFVIPEPFRAWCHECNTGFMSIEELQEHVRDKHRVYKG